MASIRGVTLHTLSGANAQAVFVRFWTANCLSVRMDSAAIAFSRVWSPKQNRAHDHEVFARLCGSNADIRERELDEIAAIRGSDLSTRSRAYAQAVFDKFCTPNVDIRAMDAAAIDEVEDDSSPLMSPKPTQCSSNSMAEIRPAAQSTAQRSH
eukprot:CAMPEP_0177566750 /NCGR_PEP_ID=MMETSP0369-20130122/74858_1 /TAXON_ID=447022 ORGANISM="Scrippsiella hangoei-like, Strain SHHI-4" /NCGR_SAMPLE_ID=MMETSP0369 /ASSEMBLY_ACC=CAM_ASM_000364 /LENGTH=152 /DNA_ID=CAMNT_0019054211 /DNA_START=379 /DNA_END=838 /DNA_ORIENTATION=-